MNLKIEKCQNYPQNLPLFLSQEWTESFCQTLDLQFDFYSLRKGESLKGYFGFFHKDKKIIQPALSYYNYFILMLEARKRENDFIHKQNSYLEEIALFIKQNYKSAYLNLSPEITDARPFFWTGFTVNPRYSFIVDLKQNLSYSVANKKSIKKAKRLNPLLTTKLDIDIFLKLNKMTFARQDASFPFSDDETKKLLTDLYQKKLLIQYNVEIDNEIKGVRLLAIDRLNGKVFDFLAASDIILMKSGVNNWLMDKIFSELSKSYHEFDFCGANIKSISRFKSAFGGKLTPFYQINWQPNKLKKFINNLR